MSRRVSEFVEHLNCAVEGGLISSYFFGGVGVASLGCTRS